MRAILLALLLVSACAHTQVGVSTTGGTRASTSSTVASVQVNANGTLAAVILAGMLVSAAAEDIPNPQPFPSLSIFSDWMRPRPAPPMQTDRDINEQDCTKPIELTGNLRCR